MDGEANLPAPPRAPPPNNLFHSIVYADTTTTTSSSSSSSSSPPAFLRQVQAAFKRHRPLGAMQTNSIKPRRMLIPQRAPSRTTVSEVGPTIGTNKSQDKVPLNVGHSVKDSIPQKTKHPVTVVGETQEDAWITPPTVAVTTANTLNESFVEQRGPRNSVGDDHKEDNALPCLHLESGNVDGKRKVQFANNATSQGADDRMATGLDNLSSHMSSLALTEMEWDASNQVETSTVINDDSKHQNLQNMEPDINPKPDGVISSLAKRTTVAQNQLHQLRNFLSQPATQSSVAGPSCATTTSVHSTSAPMLNSTTYFSHLHGSGSHVPVEHLKDINVKPQPVTQVNMEQLLYRPPKDTSGVLIDQPANATQTSSSAIDAQLKENHMPAHQYGSVPKEISISSNPSHMGRPTEEKGLPEVATDGQSRAPLSRNLSSEVKLEPSKLDRQEKVASGKAVSAARKKNYDPDLFFKVNGKLYQRLGKIGSGGSSEVHKVISSDCTIYALKKIKLRGRDYATAYGFCQEIEYLNKLKGKNNIIRLIDYEQILQAVNTIHEERIVHSDLKPANFLLVKGSLKLIDFGIAKAIMSDTTNIQRDSQVGTLSYMSPEAFMCNERDANGNTIKCGRPSDIWSLGCILYQMVYGRTPFSEYKTFWAKFKVITDPNHQISYEPVSNPWLLDLMQKCLSWDRNERWRIPQLLQHPFLVPPLQQQPSLSHDQSCKLLQFVAESCADNQEASQVCSQLLQLLREPVVPQTSQLSTSPDQKYELVAQMTKLCYQLQECLASSRE